MISRGCYAADVMKGQLVLLFLFITGFGLPALVLKAAVHSPAPAEVLSPQSMLPSLNDIATVEQNTTAPELSAMLPGIHHFADQQGKNSIVNLTD